MPEDQSKTSQTNSASPADDQHHYYYHHRPIMFVTLLVIFILIIGAIFFSHAFLGRRPIAYNSKFVGQRFAGGPDKFGLETLPGRRNFHRRGVLGAVTKIDGNDLTIRQRDKDVVVTVASDTSVYKNDAVVKRSDIKVGDVIIVRGALETDSKISAKSIIIN